MHEPSPRTVTYGDDPNQFAELWHPVTDVAARNTRLPLVVTIHGGFWREQYRLDLMHPIAMDLSFRGFTVWNIEYRRVGASGGGFPTTLDDVAAAVDHGTALAAPDQPIAVVGHSAGGHLALWNASRPNARPADLTVGLAAVVDVVAANSNGVGADATSNFFGGDVDDVADRYEAGQPQLAERDGRMILLHGDRDANVPLEQSTRAESTVDCVYVLDGSDHFDVIDPTHETWDIVRRELLDLSH